ncbi:MAG: hypothetical protein HQ582_33435 [Planctomycetes bacterium]|nr:hypothetical protein [Planctomycetota bacterium]
MLKHNLLLNHLLVLIAIVVVGAGCTDSQKAATVGPVATPPDGPLLFQPAISFAGGETTYQGTGFFVATSTGRILGVTSAHFIDFEGSPMLSARWLSIPDEDVAAEFQYSFGPPGNEGTTEPVDLRPDYLILAGDEVAPPHKPLVLDGRPQPKTGERVWLPDKDYDSEKGHTLVAGSVAEAAPEYVLVVLDERIELQSQSGSPVISQQTGKVIGTLSRGGDSEGESFLILCPSRSILSAIERDAPAIPLREAVGRSGAP